jgi:hypothetical protein
MKRDASGRPLSQELPDEALGDWEGTPNIPGCPNPLTVTNSIGHAASGQRQGCSPNAFNPSRKIKQMKARGYQFVTEFGGLITDQSSADAWRKNGRQKNGKKFKTDPTSGSAR